MSANWAKMTEDELDLEFGKISLRDYLAASFDIQSTEIDGKFEMDGFGDKALALLVGRERLSDSVQMKNIEWYMEAEAILRYMKADAMLKVRKRKFNEPDSTKTRQIVIEKE